jgi:predicted nuclease with TOPRIM domain
MTRRVNGRELIQNLSDKCSLFNILQEKQLLEEKLKEMQSLLEEKDKGEELLKKQLQEKEEQRLQDLVSCLYLEPKGVPKLQYERRVSSCLIIKFVMTVTEAATRTERCTG